MNKKSIVLVSVCIVACISLAINGVLVFLLVKDEQTYQQHQTKTKVSDFLNMFTEKVFLSDKSVDFDTRLSLETAVRGLNDSAVLSQWQLFTNSQTQAEATAQAKKLLELLIQKTSQ